MSCTSRYHKLLPRRTGVLSLSGVTTQTSAFMFTTGLATLTSWCRSKQSVRPLQFNRWRMRRCFTVCIHFRRHSEHHGEHASKCRITIRSGGPLRRLRGNLLPRCGSGHLPQALYLSLLWPKFRISKSVRKQLAWAAACFATIAVAGTALSPINTLPKVGFFTVVALLVGSFAIFKSQKYARHAKCPSCGADLYELIQTAKLGGSRLSPLPFMR